MDSDNDKLQEVNEQNVSAAADSCESVFSRSWRFGDVLLKQFRSESVRRTFLFLSWIGSGTIGVKAVGHELSVYLVTLYT